MILNKQQMAAMILPVLIRCAVAFLGLAAATTASAMEINPRVAAHLIYSDNISLDPPGDETSTFVGLLEPAININHESTRVALDVDYMFQFIWYQDIDGSDQAFHFGSVALDLALVKDKFFLETLFDRSQTQIDPTKPLGSTNIPFIINRTDRTLLQTAPHWRSPFLGQDLDIRYTVGKFKYDDPLTQDSTFQLAQSSFASPESDYGLGWRLNHQYVIFEYETPPDTKAQSLVLNFDYGFGNGFSLIGSAGLESEFGNYTSSTLEDPVWSAGFQNLSTNTDLYFAIGERSFGRTWDLSFTQRIGNKGQIVISYRQDPRTSESAYRERTETPNPGLPDLPEIPDVPPTIDRPGTGYVFVEKLGQAAFSRRFNNNTLSLLFFYQDQSDFQARGPEDIPPGNQSQIGVVLGWNMILGPKTTLFADISWVDRDFTGDDEIDDLFGGNIILSHELGRRTSLDAYYRRSQRTGADDNAFDYTENQLGISLTREF